MPRAVPPFVAVGLATLGFAACGHRPPIDSPALTTIEITSRLAERSPEDVAWSIQSIDAPRVWVASLRLPTPYSGVKLGALERMVGRADEPALGALVDLLSHGNAPPDLPSSLLLGALYAFMLRNPSLDALVLDGFERIANRAERDNLAHDAWGYLRSLDVERADRCIAAMEKGPLSWIARAEIAASERDSLTIESILSELLASGVLARPERVLGNLSAEEAAQRILNLLGFIEPGRVGRWVAPLLRASLGDRALVRLDDQIPFSPDLCELLVEGRAEIMSNPGVAGAICRALGTRLTLTLEGQGTASPDAVMRPTLLKALRWLLDELETDEEAWATRDHVLGQLFEVAPHETGEALLARAGWEGLSLTARATLAASRLARGLEVPDEAMASMRATLKAAREGTLDPNQGLAALRTLHALSISPSSEDREILLHIASTAASRSDALASAIAGLRRLGTPAPPAAIARLRAACDGIRGVTMFAGAVSELDTLNIVPSAMWQREACIALLATGEDSDIRRIADLAVLAGDEISTELRAAMREPDRRGAALCRAITDSLRFHFQRASSTDAAPALLAELAVVRPDLAEIAFSHIAMHWGASDPGATRFAKFSSRFATTALAEDPSGTIADRAIAAIDEPSTNIDFLLSIGVNVLRDSEDLRRAPSILLARLRASPERHGAYVALIDEAARLGIRNPFRYPPDVLRAMVAGHEWRDATSTTPRVLTLFPTTDHNGAYSIDRDFWRSLVQRGYSIWLVEVANDADAARVRGRAAELGGADLLVYGGHGCPNYLAMSGDSAALIGQRAALLDLTDEARLSDPSQSRALRPGGVVVLDSCQTGKGRGALPNLANMIGRAYPQASLVLAPVLSTRIHKLLFDARDRVVGIRYDEGTGYERGGFPASRE